MTHTAQDSNLIQHPCPRPPPQAHGRVAVLLAATKQAGGAPALCQDVGLASGKSIAQLFAERLLRLQRLAAEATFGRNSGAVAPIHW